MYAQTSPQNNPHHVPDSHSLAVAEFFCRDYWFLVRGHGPLALRIRIHWCSANSCSAGVQVSLHTLLSAILLHLRAAVLLAALVLAAKADHVQGIFPSVSRPHLGTCFHLSHSCGLFQSVVVLSVLLLGACLENRRPCPPALAQTLRSRSSSSIAFSLSLPEARS